MILYTTMTFKIEIAIKVEAKVKTLFLAAMVGKIFKI